jgi:hypothetical protein
MPNYFQTNAPGVVNVPVPTEALRTLFGVSVVRQSDIAVARGQLDVTYGQDVAGQGWTIDWAEYRIPGTDYVKRVEKVVPISPGPELPPFFRGDHNPDPMAAAVGRG